MAADNYPNHQVNAAKYFRALHMETPVLLLPNPWDVVSARLYECEGFDALGTTSAGIAATLGYPDGEKIDRAEMINVCARIAKSVHVPVSIDIEAGYASAPEGVAKTTQMVMDAGAVGVNIEDGSGSDGGVLVDEILQCERIAAIREVANKATFPLFINARIDAFLVDCNSSSAMSTTLKRAAIYCEAGADGIFVPELGGKFDRDLLKCLVKEIDAPLNLIAGPTTPERAELESIGVARLSFGPRAMRAGLSHIREIAREWKRGGHYSLMNKASLSYDDINEMLGADNDS